jgi:hypothetical protein
MVYIVRESVGVWKAISKDSFFYMGSYQYCQGAFNRVNGRQKFFDGDCSQIHFKIKALEKASQWP